MQYRSLILFVLSISCASALAQSRPTPSKAQAPGEVCFKKNRDGEICARVEGTLEITSSFDARDNEIKFYALKIGTPVCIIDGVYGTDGRLNAYRSARIPVSSYGMQFGGRKNGDRIALSGELLHVRNSGSIGGIELSLSGSRCAE